VPSTPASGATYGGSGLQLLESLLPTNGRVTKAPGITDATAEIWYDDGHGVVDMAVTTSHTGMKTCAGWLGGTNEGPRQPGDLPPSCTFKTLPGGATETDVVTGVDGSGFYDIEVTLVRADGVIVEMNVDNGTVQGATVDVTRTVPPLTMAQVEAIVADPRWRLY